jgi:membrane fusion protein (multidrug efflux system)
MIRTRALLLLALFAGSCSREASTAVQTAPTAAPVSVGVAPVANATVERVADLVGSFFANEEVTVASQLEARVEWIGPDMGDRVRGDQLILRLDDDDLQAQLHEVEASLAKARADNVRGAALKREGIMSNQEAERMGTDAAVLEARREFLKVQLDRTLVRSPLTGGVAARMVSVGEVVQKGRPLYKVVEDDPLKFRTPIPERFASYLRVGQEVRLGVSAYPDRTFVGKITRINPTSDQANRSISIEAEVPNPEGLVKPGFFGSGTIVYDEHSPALAVPESALVTFAGVTKLFVIKDGKAEERVVRTGVAVPEQRREITDGVSAGEQVATTNLDQLENGAPVAVTKAEPVAQAAP